jgi:hypothetical protein
MDQLGDYLYLLCIVKCLRNYTRLVASFVGGVNQV